MAIDPNGAPAGSYYDAALKRYVQDPPGTYSLAGATMPTADPGGTFSGTGASAPTTDPVGTYSSPSALNRLYIEWQNIVPAGTVLAFTSAVQVENYFGLGSVEGNEALTFFGPSFGAYAAAGATMYFGRDPIGQRPHNLSGNIANMSVADLQAISGSLNVSWNGWNYAANIDLSNVSGTQGEAAQQAVKEIQTALNMKRPTQAVVKATITPETVTFEGSFDKAQFTVTSIDSDTGGMGIIDGGIISGPGITTPSQDTQVIHDHNPPGSKGGPGSYSTFHSIKTVSSGTFTETYGLMTITSVTSGTVEDGLQVSGAGVTGFAPATGLVENVSGSGKGSQWIVDNAPSIATPETMTLKAPLLGVYLNRDGNVINGATENNEVIDLSVQGEFGDDTNPSPAMSYMSGTAAPLLNMTQDTGALQPSNGGAAFSVAHMMNLMKGEVDQFGNPISFGSVFSNDPRLDANIQLWTDTKQGMAVQYMENNGPAGQSTAVTDPTGTHSGAGASTPIWGNAPNIMAAHDLLSGGSSATSHIGEGRGYAETAVLAASPGHGPG